MKSFYYRVEQLWYQITCPIIAFYEWLARPALEWFEWEDAKCWARDHHPAWVEFARNSRHKETRQYYKEKIVAAYIGEEDGK